MLLWPVTIFVSPFSSPPSLILIIPSITPPLVSGTLCLLIVDLSHNSHLPFTYYIVPLSFLFCSLHSLYLAINSSLALNTSLSYPLPSPHNSSSNLTYPTTLKWSALYVNIREHLRMHQYPWFYGGYSKNFIYFTLQYIFWFYFIILLKRIDLLQRCQQCF